VSTRGVADVVFCLDASDSMKPCFQGVAKHVGDFLEGLKSSRQMSWDLRFDFVAHNSSQDGRTQQIRSLRAQNAVQDLYGQGRNDGRFFTTDVEELRRGLVDVKVMGNETPLVGLDVALDFPWRSASSCHRVVIHMTDEPFETGALIEQQKSVLPALLEKIQNLGVMLFLVTPESEVFARLSEVDRCEHVVVPSMNDGLSRVDFRQVLSFVGKSVSVSTLQRVGTVKVARGLFGQENWGRTDRANFSE
jgi:hypothetical protein